MDTSILGKFIPSDELIETCLLVRDTYDPKHDAGDYKRWSATDEIIAHFEGLNYTAGNIYYHETPYAVHTDVFTSNIGVNVLVPLERDTPQKFIVFDQTYHGSTVWLPGEPYSAVEKGMSTIITGRPCQTPVEGLTGMPCGIADYLQEENSFYDGLSGTVIDWMPGEAIVFPSINLHATGIMDKPKYGLAMWFDNTVEEVCLAMKKSS